MSNTKDLGKIGLTRGFFNSEQNRLDHIIVVSSDPNGVVIASQGTIAIDTNSPSIYQNINGTDTWRNYNVDIDVTSDVNYVTINEPNTYLLGDVSHYINNIDPPIPLNDNDILLVDIRVMEAGMNRRKTYLMKLNGAIYGLGNSQTNITDFQVIYDYNKTEQEIILVNDYPSLSITAGDPQEDFNQKILTEVESLQSTSGEANTVTNLGIGADLFKQKTGSNLEFYSLQAEGGLFIYTSGDTVRVSGNSILSSIHGTSNISTDFTLTASENNKILFIENGSNNVTITVPQIHVSSPSRPFAVGIVKLGTGDITISPGSGVSLAKKTFQNYNINGYLGSVAIVQRSPNSVDYVILGDLETPNFYPAP